MPSTGFYTGTNHAMKGQSVLSGLIVDRLRKYFRIEAKEGPTRRREIKQTIFMAISEWETANQSPKVASKD